MAFEYMGYKIERYDENNVNLYQWRSVNHTDKDTKVVTSSNEWVRLGYYNTFFGATRALMTRLAEAATNITQLKDIVTKWEFIHKELAL
jgi:hypothetical protein